MSLIDELVKEATTPMPVQRTTARSRLESRRAGLPYNPGGAPAPTTPTPPTPAAPAAATSPATPATPPAPSNNGGFWSTVTGMAAAPFVAGGQALHGLASTTASPWVHGNTGSAVASGGISSGLTPRASAQRKGNFLDELVKRALQDDKPCLNPEEQGPQMAFQMATEDAKSGRTLDLTELLA